MEQINLAIVDDHELFRYSLRMKLESRYPEIHIAGEAAKGTELFGLLETVAVDIVLLDVMMPGMNGIEVARRLKTQYPAVKILAISSDNSAQTIQEMLHIGIDGFISKNNCNGDILIEAIHTIMQGFEFFGQDISEIISRVYLAKKNTARITDEFTELEKCVIQYSIEGLTAKKIADRMFLSPRTVDWHKSNIFKKLGINSTLELVKFAVKNGIFLSD
jgi:DNA-binding NarL/FixJ family response regulator